MTEVVDQKARDNASEALHMVKNHIQVTGIKLDNLDVKIDRTHDDLVDRQSRIEAILKYAGGLIIALFISTLTWSLTQQYNNNEAVKSDLKAQIALVQEQKRNSGVAQADRAEILSRLPPASAATSTDPTVSGR